MMDELLVGETAEGDGPIRKVGTLELTEAQRQAVEQFLSSPEFQSTLRAIEKRLRVQVERVHKALVPVWETTRKIGSALAPAVAVFMEKVGPILERSVLPNWPFVEADPELISTILVDEGIALAWVPPPAVLKRLLLAPDRQARRRVIGSCWKGIVNSCLAELEEIDDSGLLVYRDFAEESARALLGGFSDPSQALSANLIDTLLNRYLDNDLRVQITGRKKTKLDTDMHTLREWFVLAGVSGAHDVYDGRLGDPVPRGFTRHGTAHAVSVRQYSRINAVIALMHVVALLRLFNSQPRTQ